MQTHANTSCIQASLLLAYASKTSYEHAQNVVQT